LDHFSHFRFSTDQGALVSQLTVHVFTKPFNALLFPFDTSFSRGTYNSSKLMTVRILHGTTKTYIQLFFALEIKSYG